MRYETYYIQILRRRIIAAERNDMLNSNLYPAALEGRNLSEDEIFDYITKNIEGDCLLAVGDESLIKIHFHTNTPWKVVEYAASLGEIYDIVIENMERQEQGLQG